MRRPLVCLVALLLVAPAARAADEEPDDSPGFNLPRRKRMSDEDRARYDQALKKREEEEVARKKAEEAERQRLVEEERARKAAELKRLEDERKAAQEARVKAEEERRAAEAARKKAEEEKRLAEEAKKKAVEEKRLAEEGARKRAEDEKRALEEAKKKAVEEQRLAEEAKKKAAEEERLAQEAKRQAEEAKKAAALDEKARLEAQKKAKAEEAGRLVEEKKRAAEDAKMAKAEEKKRLAEEAKRLVEEKRRAAEDAKKVKADEEVRAQEEERRIREAARLAMEEEKRRIQEEKRGGQPSRAADDVERRAAPVVPAVGAPAPLPAASYTTVANPDARRPIATGGPVSVSQLAEPAAPSRKLKLFQAGAGLLFWAGSSFMDEPNDRLTYPGSGELLPYFGFGGFSPGGALSLDVRFWEFVGLEVVLARSWDHAQTTINDVKIFVDQTAFHLPLLLKLTLPTQSARPQVFGGIELVFPGTPTTSTSIPVPTEIAAHAANYSLWAFGFGFEIPSSVAGQDLRIPIALRGALNRSTPAAARDRMTWETSGAALSKMDFSSEWQWHAAITVGVTWHTP